MNDMYSQFETDKNAEQTGIIIDYGSYRVTIGRAGGANKKFINDMRSRTKPLQRIIANDQLSDKKADTLVRESFAKTIVFNWEVKKEVEQEVNIGQGHTEKQMVDTWEQGINGRDGTILPFTPENVINVFKDLPDLFADLQEHAGKAASFNRSRQEEEAKN